MLPFLLASSAARAGDVDTQFIFGFTQGSDVGELREKEIESETVGRFGKADGSYAVLTSQLRAEFTPAENFRFEVGAIVNYSSISGVSGLDDRSGSVPRQDRDRVVRSQPLTVSVRMAVTPSPGAHCAIVSPAARSQPRIPLPVAGIR